MTEMPSDFWSGWIIVLTVVSLIGLTWLVFSVYFSPRAKAEKSQVWDETLTKGDNAPPMWWFWLLFSALVFTVAYLMLYPGLGSYKGALEWTQGGRLGEAYALYDYEFEDLRQELLETSWADLQSDPDVMRSARNIYNRNCTACHGHDGKGQANMFPNLMDNIWQWGGDPAQIEQSIRFGRRAVMPAWEAALDETAVGNVAAYIQTIGEAGEDHPGKLPYSQFCIACHGVDGTGNIALGAPDLSDDDWVYGHSESELAHSISKGRNGVMPAFGKRLDDVQIHMLAAWLTR